VAALVVDNRGAILAHAVKKPEEGGCQHAEVQALFTLKGQLPAGGALFTTLKPCSMCAGLIQACDEGGKLRKYWVRDDPTSGADWSYIDREFKLTSGFLLDKNCQVNQVRVKGLKLVDKRDFATAFTAAREQSEKARTGYLEGKLKPSDLPDDTINKW